MDDAIDQATGTEIRYAIRIRGTLGETVMSAFPGLEPQFREGDTVLIGQLADQSALHGVLGQVEALGLELVEVWRLSGTTIQAPLVPSAPHARRAIARRRHPA